MDVGDMFMRKSIQAVSTIIIAVIAMAATPVEPTLKEIMQGLRDHLLEISDGLVTDDFARVAQGAGGIAKHAPISEPQVEVILAELGPEMSGFKQFDELVHESSLSLTSAAKERNREAAILHYHRMLDGCLACHALYKDRIAAALIQHEAPVR